MKYSNNNIQRGSTFDLIEERDSILQASMKSQSTIKQQHTTTFGNSVTIFDSSASLKHMLNMTSHNLKNYNSQQRSG